MHTKFLNPALAFLALCSCATPQQTTARHSPSGTSIPASTPHQSEMVVSYDANGVPSFSFKRNPGDEQPEDETVRYNSNGSVTVHQNSAFARASGMTDEEVSRCDRLYPLGSAPAHLCWCCQAVRYPSAAYLCPMCDSWRPAGLPAWLYGPAGTS
jgi:hypothetical protein